MEEKNKIFIQKNFKEEKIERLEDREELIREENVNSREIKS